MKTVIMMLVLSFLTVGAIPARRDPMYAQIGRKLVVF